MNNFIFKSLLIVLLIASVGANAQQISDYSVLPEGISTAPDNTADILIILDNSMSMANGPNGLIGGHHQNSRSGEARAVIREVLADIDPGGVSVGLMEFDIGWSLSTGNNRNVAVNTCGDKNPPRRPEDLLTHQPTPLLENCATPNSNGEYQLDSFGRIIADNPTTNFRNMTLPDDTGIGRLRVGIEPLTAEHLERINRVLSPEPQMPEIRCNNTFAQTVTINGVRQCAMSFNDDYGPDNFPAGVTPSLENESERIETDSWLLNDDPSFGSAYGFNLRLFSDLDANGVPAMYNDPTAPSLPTFGTATYGALVSAHNYLRGTSNENMSMLLQPGDSGETPITSSTPITDSSTSGLCTASTFILLITDGQPFSLLNGETINDNPNEGCTNPLLSELPNGEIQCTPINNNIEAHSRNSIAPFVAAMRLGYDIDVSPNGNATIRDTNFNSIETFVFGFAGLGNSGTRIANLIANSGSMEDDNTPRGAFVSSNRDELREDLTQAFSDIIPMVSSNSGININASPTTGGGAIVSSSYNPVVVSDDGTQTVNWVGSLTSFFIDDFGFLREDGDMDQELDDYVTDPAFSLSFNVIDGVTEVQRLNIDATNLGTENFDPNTDITDNGAIVSPLDIVPIWEAGSVLNSYTQTVSNINIFGSIQRAYSAPANEANGYRRIYTSLPNNVNPENIAQIDFLPSLVTGNNFGLFAVDTEEEAESVIRYIRGEEGIQGFRNRTIDGEQFLLGDIVHSTAAIVDVPSADFGSRFGDASYVEFQNAYRFRRRVAYIGGNDGMLHAFNAGFFDSQNTAFELTAAEIGCTAASSPTGCDNIAHELGAEIWSYVPQNLLPHLQFLTDTDYNSSVHVAYVDGPVLTFDAQIFDDDAVHVNGWGTIAVVGLRLGGGDFEVDPNNDGNTSDNITTRSAYIIVDVTDPSQEPVVLAEITDIDLGFATTNTQILRDGDDWYLTFGSGPNDHIDFISEPIAGSTAPRNPTFYKYRLDQDTFVTNRLEKIPFTPTIGGSSFIGDLTSHDWNSDTFDDAVYFGLVAGNTQTPSGGMYRYVNDPNSSQSGSVRPLLITNQPVHSAPVATTNSGLNWVLFGTGRYLANSDLENNTLNSFFGVKEPRDTYPLQSLISIVDVTNVSVNADTDELTPEVENQSTSESLSNFIIADDAIAGWKIDFSINPLPSDRTTAAPITIGDQVLYATFSPNMPSETECEPVFGESFLNIGGITNGLPSGIASLGVDEQGNIVDSISVSPTAITSLSAINVLDTQSGDATPSVIISTEGSEIDTEIIGIEDIGSGRSSWIELEIQ